VSPQTVELAAELLSSLLATRRPPLRRWLMLGLGVAVAALGALYLTIAADLALSEILPPSAAAAIVGAALLAVALILVVIGSVRRRARVEELPIAALTELATRVLGQFEESVQASPKTAAATAFAAGCIVASSPELLRGLRKLVP
jgi:hypothetical protein